MACYLSSDEEEVLLAAATFGDLSNFKNAAKDLDKGKGIKKTILKTKDAMGRGALHLAAGEGRMNICQYLIEELGLLPDVHSNRGKTPLHSAASEGRIEVVKYLTDAGANPNFSDLTGTTPLFLAVGAGHIEVVEHLLSKGVPVDPENFVGTPLFFAAICNQEATMEILLNYYADVNMVTANMLTLTPLKMAVMTGSLNCTRLLIKAGADVNLKAPIVNASELNSVEILMCLLDAGADPNVPDIYGRFGRFAIEAAALSGNMGIVEMLFPITYPLPKVAHWNLRGVFSYVNSKAYMKKFEAQRQKISNDLKRKGDDALRRKEYIAALRLYSPVLPIDATMCANRSSCWLHVGDPHEAFADAHIALSLKPDWPEAYYRLGAALMSLKKYRQAFQVLLYGFKINPADKSIEKALREAAEAMKKADV